MQKRSITDTMRNLHKKFLSNNLGHISYTIFCRLKPFWVVNPSSSDRDTRTCNLWPKPCRTKGFCLLHIEEISEATMCKAKACAYGECKNCLHTCHPMLKTPGQENISLSQWKTEKAVRDRHPQVSIIHLFSDGPATQYRQKGNFFYLSTEPYKYGFMGITWNFFEASHGKGAPDGVGGALKRSADRIVAQGGDIPDAQSLYDKLRSLDTSVELFFISEI